MKFVCFDIGNVLCDVIAQPFLENLSETFNISVSDAGRFLKRFQQLHDLGYTTMADELQDHFNVRSSVTIKRLVKAWNESVIPNQFILGKLNELQHKEGLQIALLSNIGVEHAELVKEKMASGGFFDKSIKHFSCFVGARKPTSIYYQSFLQQYPDFKGCLYVDDLQVNLDASKAFGFQTFRLALDEPDASDKIRELEEKIKNMP